MTVKPEPAPLIELRSLTTATVLNDRSSRFHSVEIAIVAWVDFVSGPEWSVRGGLLLERL
jgi:hypothetical protein